MHRAGARLRAEELRLELGVEGLALRILNGDVPESLKDKKLLSLELTGAWINEAREVPKAILEGLTGRVGRYPKKEGGKGGGGSSSTASSTPTGVVTPQSTQLSGTAAIGAPISGVVVAIDINGKVSPPATTSALENVAAVIRRLAEK